MGKNRQYIYVPQMVKDTFVFFYFRGDENGYSWSIRDYSKPGSPNRVSPGRFPAALVCERRACHGRELCRESRSASHRT